MRYKDANTVWDSAERQYQDMDSEAECPVRCHG